MADITVTIPNSTFTIDTISNGIEVTTPTSVEINVDSNSNIIDITNTPQQITVLTSGTVIQQSGITSVNGNTGPVVVLTTTNIAEGTNLYYTTARANTDFDTRLATKSTTNLAEGSNLYYTTARANTDFDARLATKTTDNLNEGTTNQYFTTARSRTAISSSDTGGLGSLSYNNSTGVITYTGASDSEVRALFTGGTGVTYNNTTGEISIGQSVATSDSVTFSSVNLDNRAVLDTLTLTTSATTADQVLDSFSAATYRTAKYLISINSGSDYHSLEMLVNHNGTTANQTTYADLPTGSSLATFTVDISGGNVRLLTTPTNTVTVYKVTRTAVVV